MTASWIAVVLLAAACSPGLGQSPSEDHFPITTRLVAQTLSRQGMQTAGLQVSLLARVVATEPFPTLDVLSVEPLDDAPSARHSDSHSRVKVACRLPGTCLPFYAIVSWPQGTVAATATQASPVVRNPVNPAAKTSLEITMRVGSHATLVMDDHRSHIQVAVVSLENGVAGKWIRVASPDHKQVYTGEVISASLLRGNF